MLYLNREILSKNNFHEKILFNSSEITLKVKGTGMKNIKYSSKSYGVCPCPSFVILTEKFNIYLHVIK